MGTQTIKIAILKCSNCGAPMHPDAGATAFLCPFCGNVVPFSDHTVKGARPLVYKHHAVEMQDGLIKLIRVAVMVGAHSSFGKYDLLDPDVRWARSFHDRIAAIDRRAYVTRRDRFDFSFVCVHCGGAVSGSSTQTMFTCDHCGTVYGLDDLEDLGLNDLPQIVGNQSMVPSKCLAFKLSPQQAQARIRYLVSQNPGFFAGYNVEELLRGGALDSVYTPASLCDLALRVNADSSLGKTEYYMEWIDWTLPRDTGLDVGLLDRLAPWDFNDAGVFIPEFVMGDVIICAATNFESKIDLIDALSARMATEAIVERYGAERVQLILWSRDFVEHKSGLIALPVFSLEQLNGPGEGLRIMVNGQSGAVQAAVREGGRERFCSLPGASDGRVDGERSMHLAPVPVKYEKPSHLYRVLTPQEAFGRKASRIQNSATGSDAAAPSATSGAPSEKRGLFSRIFGK